MSILDYFPKKSTPRPKQVKALEYIQKKVSEGFRDIVIAAPTGLGKSLVGITVARWARSEEFAKLVGVPQNSQSYYLVCQKMLQDQLEHEDVDDLCSIKSSVNYECRRHKNCQTGSLKKCTAPREGNCTYKRARDSFLAAGTGVTNYSFWMTDKTYNENFQERPVVIFDECHQVEEEIVRFVNINLTEDDVEKCLSFDAFEIKDMADFIEFLTKYYVPDCTMRLKSLTEIKDLELSDADLKELAKLEEYIGRVQRMTNMVKEDPDNWVYWTSPRGHHLAPLEAKMLFSQFSKSTALRVYMSAFPGSKKVFCQNLGLDPENVAWFNMSSEFKVENRRVIYVPVGSMSMKNKSDTFGSLVNVLIKICNTKMQDEKGIIHSHSYELTNNIYAAVQGRLSHKVFTHTPETREEAFKNHCEYPGPSVIISPSMYEGFDFKDDLARFGIIVKVPYPGLGDLRTSIKLERNREWYDMKAVMAIVQACGRTTRSYEDHSVNLILDSDFLSLYNNTEHLWPKWFKDSLIMDKK